MPVQTHIFVGDNLNILNVTSSLENLTKNILGDPLVQSTNVQRPLVRLGSCSSEAASAGWGHHIDLTGRGDGSRDGIVVLGDMQRRRRKGLSLSILDTFESRCASIGLRCGVGGG